MDEIINYYDDEYFCDMFYQQCAECFYEEHGYYEGEEDDE